MKHVLMIMTLCVTLLGSAHAMSFTDVTSQQFLGSEYSVVAWGDVDANGYADLFLGVVGAGQSRLLLNTGSGWVNAEDAYEVATISHVQTARFVDYDRDGRLDLFCLTGNEEGAELYRQTANSRYQRVDMNLDAATDETIRSATWCDADQDGALDLLLSNRSEQLDESVLLIQSAEVFVEARGASGPFTELLVNQISTVDFDQDGDIDYLISKTDGSTSLWKNLDQSYRNYGPVLGLPAGLAQSGVTWADFNRDGMLDFFACGSSENNCLFYQTAGDPTNINRFENKTDQFGLREITKGATSAHAIDANADGWMDLFLVRARGNVLLINRRQNGWQQMERATQLMQPNRDTRSCAWGDYDNDGDLDLAMAQGTNGVKLFRNDSEITREFVALKLCGSGECMTPVLDCLVEVEFPYGKQWAATSMYAGTIGSDDYMKVVYNPSFQHSEEWTVNVLWPNGLITTLTEQTIPLNGVVELHMPGAATPGNHELSITPVIATDVANYPNPFNPTTNIEFTLNDASFITLAIYNLLGQEVATLASGAYEAGLHSLVFDATALPSGLYLARLEAPSGTVVHRMLLTK